MRHVGQREISLIPFLDSSLASRRRWAWICPMYTERHAAGGARVEVTGRRGSCNSNAESTARSDSTVAFLPLCFPRFLSSSLGFSISLFLPPRFFPFLSLPILPSTSFQSVLFPCSPFLSPRDRYHRGHTHAMHSGSPFAMEAEEGRDPPSRGVHLKVTRRAHRARSMPFTRVRGTRERVLRGIDWCLLLKMRGGVLGHSGNIDYECFLKFVNRFLRLYDSFRSSVDVSDTVSVRVTGFTLRVSRFTMSCRYQIFAVIGKISSVGI